MHELVPASLAFGPFSHANGYALVSALCLLLFIEECGVPLPFAPGDLVLVLCGVTVAGSHLQAWTAIVAASGAIVLGAFAGRELFARAGAAAVYRIANLLRMRTVLDRMAGALRRLGWYGVLLGRLTPGLRVHTTEAAGVIGMPRKTFALGMLPAVAVYVAAFFGLGFWLGPTAWSTIQSFMPKPGPLIVLAAAVVGIIATVRWIVGNVEGPLLARLARRSAKGSA